MGVVGSLGGAGEGVGFGSATLPPCPVVAAEERNDTVPVFPLLDVPEAMRRDPLTPAAPAFDVCSASDPLEDTVLPPLTIARPPPDAAPVVAPAPTSMFPPDALSPSPT